ncbi:MAG: PaaI family thioesterase [Candidatus Helarchaeota archaeon]|nr:PaaI family thioesterase [Candidatus Helarchaeota archaeon]
MNLNEHEIPNYWTGNCFGCSRKNTQGLNLHFWSTEKGCYTKCAIPEHLCGIDGLVHGGIITLLLEEVAQWTIISHLGMFGVTREISVRYLKPVPTKTEILVEAQITNQGEKNIVFRSIVNNSEGILLVESESNWIFVSPSAIAKVTAVDELMLREFLAKYTKKVEG